MGCFSAETSFEMPSWLEGPSKNVASAANKALKKPFTPYTDPRVADMSGTQTSAIEQLKQILGIGGGAGIKIPRLIDAVPGASGGPEGTTQDYMNPYLEQVLNPVIRQLNLQRDYGLAQNDASATMAGAFRDTGHALERAKTLEGAGRNVTDATGQIYSSAYQDAMQRKGADIDRIMTNRDATTKYLQDLFNMGGVETGISQAKLDAQYEEFMRKTGYDLDTIGKVAAILGGLPQPQMVQQPSTMGSILGGISGIGSLFMKR